MVRVVLLSQRPLTASNLDQQLFTDRVEVLHRVLSGLDLGLNVLLSGPPGSGRTSVLHRIRHELHSSVVFVNARPWRDPLDLVLAVRAALGDDSRDAPRYESRSPFQDALVHAGLSKRVDPKPTVTESDVIGIRTALENSSLFTGSEPRVILLDDPDASTAATLFGAFRDTLWEASVHWVVGVTDRLRGRLLRPPSDAFFGLAVDLDELTDSDAAELLMRRADLARGVTGDQLRSLIPRIINSVPERQPRALLQNAVDALASTRPAEALDAVAVQQMSAARLGRSEAMLFEELRALGPVHAGDQRLQERMGLTRSRLVQLLRALEGAGLVRSYMDRQRKMYSAATTESESL